MTNFPSFSNPPFNEYQWDEVDWDNPFPGDLVALHELYCKVQAEYIQNAMQQQVNGATLEDLPPFSLCVWDNVIVVTGLAPAEAERSESIYEDMSRLHWAGAAVREDRLMSCLNDEQLEEYLEARDSMSNAVADFLNDPDTQDIVSDMLTQLIDRDQEIETLNNLFNESGE